MVYVLDCVVLVWYVCCMTNTNVHPAVVSLPLPGIPVSRRRLLRLEASVCMSSASVPMYLARAGSLVVADARDVGDCVALDQPFRVSLVSPGLPRVAGWVREREVDFVPVNEPVAL